MGLEGPSLHRNFGVGTSPPLGGGNVSPILFLFSCNVSLMFPFADLGVSFFCFVFPFVFLFVGVFAFPSVFPRGFF